MLFRSTDYTPPQPTCDGSSQNPYFCAAITVTAAETRLLPFSHKLIKFSRYKLDELMKEFKTDIVPSELARPHLGDGTKDSIDEKSVDGVEFYPLDLKSKAGEPYFYFSFYFEGTRNPKKVIRCLRHFVAYKQHGSVGG